MPVTTPKIKVSCRSLSLSHCVFAKCSESKFDLSF
jgi:hypothetical protein